MTIIVNISEVNGGKGNKDSLKTGELLHNLLYQLLGNNKLYNIRVEKEIRYGKQIIKITGIVDAVDKDTVYEFKTTSVKDLKKLEKIKKEALIQASLYAHFLNKKNVCVIIYNLNTSQIHTIHAEPLPFHFCLRYLLNKHFMMNSSNILYEVIEVVQEQVADERYLIEFLKRHNVSKIKKKKTIYYCRSKRYQHVWYFLVKYRGYYVLLRVFSKRRQKSKRIISIVKNYLRNLVYKDDKGGIYIRVVELRRKAKNIDFSELFYTLALLNAKTPKNYVTFDSGKAFLTYCKSNRYDNIWYFFIVYKKMLVLLEVDTNGFEDVNKYVVKRVIEYVKKLREETPLT